MKNKFTINKRTLLGYGVIVILVFGIVVSTYLNHKNNKACVVSMQAIVATPALEELHVLKNLLDRAAFGSILWYSQYRTDAPQKQELLKLIETEYPNLKKEVQTLSVKWNTEDKDSINKILESTDSLLIFCTKTVINKLQTIDSYQDPVELFLITEDVERINAWSISLKKDVSKLINKQKADVASVSKALFSSSNDLEKVTILLNILLVVCAFLIVFLRVQK